jgi:NADPH:quinone reductase-like Zn-dependent oxidoreductase
MCLVKKPMKAIVYTKYGPPNVLRLVDIEKPIPRENEVLVRIHATTVNRTDCATIRAKPFFMRIITGLLKPKKHIPGTEFAGEVEAVGENVLSFKTGDRVFGFDDQGTEAHAQYTAIPENKILTIPDAITYEQAAASCEGTYYAYNFIKKVNLKKGQNVLVNGATGAIGSAAVQLLKYFDANVTAGCATRNIGLVKSLGASRVVDYTKVDFTSDDLRYDFIFDTVGKSSFFKCIRLLQPGGIYISSDLGYLAQNLVLPSITSVIKPLLGNRKSVFPNPADIRGSMLLLKKLMEQQIFKAVIDKTYPLEEIIDAFKYVEIGHKTGNVVISLDA